LVELDEHLDSGAKCACVDDHDVEDNNVMMMMIRMMMMSYSGVHDG